MYKKKLSTVYIKESTIPNIGKGLFAKTNIKNGSIIIEFRGRLRKPNEKILSSWSNIYFIDGYVLECQPNDIASFANDVIDFNGRIRQLMKSFKSCEPFYKKYPNFNLNAQIKINNNYHRAFFFLIATNDIDIDHEIFCHYGFQYWFKKEITTIGFLREDEIEQNGFPEKVFEFPAFVSYIKEFYPTSIEFKCGPFKNGFVVTIIYNNNNNIVVPIENFANYISKISY